jgi:EpsI family protein
MEILEDKIVEVAPGFSVTYLLMEQAGVHHAGYYWFFRRGRWISNDFSAKFFMGYDALLRHRNDGAMIRLITPAAPNVDAALKRLEVFSQTFIPLLPQFIP